MSTDKSRSDKENSDANLAQKIDPTVFEQFSKHFCP
jgi:hypothetical protein